MVSGSAVDAAAACAVLASRLAGLPSGVGDAAGVSMGVAAGANTVAGRVAVAGAGADPVLGIVDAAGVRGTHAETDTPKAINRLSRSNLARPGLPNPGQNRGFGNPLRAFPDLLRLT